MAFVDNVDTTNLTSKNNARDRIILTSYWHPCAPSAFDYRLHRPWPTWCPRLAAIDRRTIFRILPATPLGYCGRRLCLGVILISACLDGWTPRFFAWIYNTQKQQSHFSLCFSRGWKEKSATDEAAICVFALTSRTLSNVLSDNATGSAIAAAANGNRRHMRKQLWYCRRRLRCSKLFKEAPPPKSAFPCGSRALPPTIFHLFRFWVRLQERGWGNL